MKFTLLFLSVCLSVAAVATPVVSGFSVVQDGSRQVKVAFTLSEPAIVTLAAETNRGDGVYCPIGDENIGFLTGDANRVVGAGQREIVWRPTKSWPQQVVTGGKMRIGVKAWATNAPPDWMVVDLKMKGFVRYYSSEAALPFPGGVTNDLCKSDYLVLRRIPAAAVEWRMGSPADETGRETGGGEDIRIVQLSDDYYMAVYEMTQKQYEHITGSKPAQFVGAFNPVENVSYQDLRGVGTSENYSWPVHGHEVDATSALGLLRSHARGIEFDLPTEAQWEFACRACTAGRFNVDGLSLADLGWYKTISESMTHPVGMWHANAWRLYDLHGNVAEMCLDLYGSGIPEKGAEGEPVLDPKGALPGASSPDYCLWRGGRYDYEVKECRSASRTYWKLDYRNNGVGFRVVCPVAVK